MSFKHTFSILLILATLHVGLIKATEFSEDRALACKCLIFFSAEMAFFLLLNTPIEKLRIDKKIIDYYVSWNTYRNASTRLQKAKNTILESLKKEDDAMLLLVSDIDKTMKYSAQPHQAELHADINQFIHTLRHLNKTRVIYNTNKDPVGDFLDIMKFAYNMSAEEGVAYEGSIIYTSLNTLPEPDAVIYQGGRRVCYMSDVVQDMRSRIFSNKLCNTDPTHGAWSFPFWKGRLYELSAYTPGERRFDWRFSGAEAMYTFRSDTEAKASQYLADEFEGSPTMSSTSHNLPTSPSSRTCPG